MLSPPSSLLFLTFLCFSLHDFAASRETRLCCAFTLSFFHNNSRQFAHSRATFCFSLQTTHLLQIPPRSRVKPERSAASVLTHGETVGVTPHTTHPLQTTPPPLSTTPHPLTRIHARPYHPLTFLHQHNTTRPWQRVVRTMGRNHDLWSFSVLRPRKAPAVGRTG